VVAQDVRTAAKAMETNFNDNFMMDSLDTFSEVWNKIVKSNKFVYMIKQTTKYLVW